MLPNEDIQDTEKAFAKTTILTSGAHISMKMYDLIILLKHQFFRFGFPQKESAVLLL